MPRKEFDAFTRLDASDVNTFLMDQSVMTFADSTARASAITTPVEGMVTYLNDIDALSIYNGEEYVTNRPIQVFAGTAARGSAIPTPTQGMYTHLNDTDSLQYWDGSDWVGVASAGTASFSFVETLYITSSGSFTKATYPWLRAIKVTACGGGGGAGGAATTGGGQIAIGGVGAGGAGSITFINDISSLDASVTVTVGAGGAGGAAGNNDGSAGGDSSFGTVCVATGGGAGQGQAAVAAPITGGVNGTPTIGSNVGDLTLNPGSVQRPIATSATLATPGFRPVGGDSGLDKNFRASIASAGNGADAIGIGIGGNAGGNSQNNATARPGGNGAAGIVIMELYA